MNTTDLTAIITTVASTLLQTSVPYAGNDTEGHEMDNSSTTSFDEYTVPAGLKRGSQPAYLFKYRIVPSFYIILCLVGIVGNGVVIKVLWSIMRKNTLQSVTDILVINLAIADFIFVGSLPFWATELFMHKRWIFGTVGCKLMSFITLLNLYGSVFFLVAMGIDRYLAVVYAVRARNYRTPRNATIACAVIWSFASLIGLEALVLREVEYINSKNRCVWQLPDGPEWTTTYYVLRVLLGFVLPFLVIVFCYILIIIKLHRRAKSSRLTGSSMTNKQQKITRAILAVISLFVVCWLPNHIVTVILAVTTNDEATRRKLDLTTANLVSVCLAYANSSFNPILYAFMKEEIRQEGTELIINIFTCCKSNQTDFHGGKKSRFRLSKLSFWRSTRHTMLMVIPANGQDVVNVDGLAAKEKEGDKYSPGTPDQEVESRDSLEPPTSPDITEAKSDNVILENIYVEDMSDVHEPMDTVIVSAKY